MQAKYTCIACWQTHILGLGSDEPPVKGCTEIPQKFWCLVLFINLSLIDLAYSLGGQWLLTVLVSNSQPVYWLLL